MALRNFDRQFNFTDLPEMDKKFLMSLSKEQVIAMGGLENAYFHYIGGQRTVMGFTGLHPNFDLNSSKQASFGKASLLFDKETWDIEIDFQVYNAGRTTTFLIEPDETNNEIIVALLEKEEVLKSLSIPQGYSMSSIKFIPRDSTNGEVIYAVLFTLSPTEQ